LAALNLGFLTVLSESSGYLGGYLVTNTWGRPLEFRLSTAVQPNKVQQVLYGPTLRSYIFADLIGKTLVEKATVTAGFLLSDAEPVLELRHRVEMPVVWVLNASEPVPANASLVLPAATGRGPILAHPHFPADVGLVQQYLTGVQGLIDLSEPFARIREAITEARKMGVTGRAA
jgi:hypothetical protein